MTVTRPLHLVKSTITRSRRLVNQSRRLTVLLAGSRPLVREAIRTALDPCDRIEVVGEASDDLTARELLRGFVADVAVLDHSPGTLDALSLLRLSRRSRLTTRVVVLTEDSKGFARQAYDSGAAACLATSVTSEQIVAAVFACGLLGLVVPWNAPRQVAHAEPAMARALLSAREKQVLQLLAHDKRPEAIARELFLSPATVRTHLTRTYRKLLVSGAPAAVAEGLRGGLID
jgi:DNA-binding NarL/FixJ family response regulator